MKKYTPLILLFIFIMLAVAGCQNPNRRSDAGPALSEEELVNIYYLAGKLGMTVTGITSQKITLADKQNTVDLYTSSNHVYINNEYVSPLGKTKKIDDMLHVRASLEQQIRSKTKKTIVTPIVPEKVKPIEKPKPMVSGVKIVIDAGHGGKDPGATSTYGFYEKTVNLDVALQLADLLSARGFNVIMTRKNDVFVELEDRAAIANQSNAKLFVSIHADSCSTSGTNGFTLYVARQASWASKQLANSIDAQMAKTGIKSRGTKDADYKVLKFTRCPAVLVELGYLSNYWEAKQLKNKDMQKKLAQTIADGITNYVKGR